MVDLVAHRRFHTAIYVASHNDLLISTLDGAVGQGRPVPPHWASRSCAARRSATRRTREHAELLDAVIRGDSDGAAEVMRQHIDTSLGAKAASRLGADDQPPGLTRLS